MDDGRPGRLRRGGKAGVMSWRRCLRLAGALALPGIAVLTFGAAAAQADGPPRCDGEPGRAAHGDCQHRDRDPDRDHDRDRNHDRDDRPTPKPKPTPTPTPRATPTPAPVVPAPAPP